MRFIEQEEVDARLCTDPQPSVTETCWLPCADDCVLSDWSTWSSCSSSTGSTSLSCARTGTRTRHRHVLASATATGKPDLCESK